MKPPFRKVNYLSNEIGIERRDKITPTGGEP